MDGATSAVDQEIVSIEISETKTYGNVHLLQAGKRGHNAGLIQLWFELGNGLDGKNVCSHSDREMDEC